MRLQVKYDVVAEVELPDASPNASHLEAAIAVGRMLQVGLKAAHAEGRLTAYDLEPIAYRPAGQGLKVRAS